MAGQGTISILGFKKPLGHEQILAASLVAAFTFDSKTNTRVLYIQVEGGSVRWRDDGVAPTAGIGMLLQDGQTLEYTGDISKLQFIQSTGASILNAAFYA